MLQNKQVKLVFSIVFFALFACFMASAQTSVKFTFANGQFNALQYTNVQVILQPEQLNVNGTVTILTPKIYQYTDTNASTTFSNLFGSTTGGFYHWTVPAFTSADGNNPPVTSQGDIQVTSTNLGLISSTTIGVVFVPVYNGSGAAWTAQASDLRYAQSTNVLTSYVQIGQLNSTSNSIVAQIPSTNGFITASALSSYATTNYANSVTNNFTSIVYSNPTAFTTPNQVTNLINALATTNGISAATATNIANAIYSNNPSGYLTGAATNFAVGTNFVNTAISATNSANLAITTNLVNSTVIAATNALATTNQLNSYVLTTVYTAGTNSVATNALANLISTNALLIASLNAQVAALNASIATSSNLLQSTKQNGSLILSNLAGTGAFTNGLIAAQGIYLATNFNSTIISINASNQTFLTNGYGTIVTHNSTDYISTNALPALTNAFLTSASLATYATTGYVASAISGANINTNQYAAGANNYLTTNFNGTIIYINSSNQTFLTNGYGSIVTHAATDYILTNALPALTNGFVTSAITNGLIGASVTNGLATTNYVNAQGFVTAAVTNGLATTNFVLSTLTASNANFATYATLIASNTANLIITTNLVNAATNALALTSYVATALAPYSTTAALTNATNALWAAIVNTNSTTLAIVTNLVTAATNSPIFVLTNNPQYVLTLTNPAQFVASANGNSTNLTLQGVFVMGAKTNFVYSTNIVGMTTAGIGGVAGTYLGSGGIWTNVFNSAFTISLAGGNYYLMSNSTSLYASTNVINWALVSGSNPTPTGSFGHYDYDNGTIYNGWFYSTNLTWQMTNNVGLYAYNFSSNSIQNQINQYAVNPTNGITASTATNIAQYVYSNNPSGYVTYTVTNGAVYTNGNTSSGQIIYSTNNGVGYYWGAAPSGGGGGSTTNFLLSGVITNFTTNTMFSAAATNTISYIASTVSTSFANSNTWLLSGNTLAINASAKTNIIGLMNTGATEDSPIFLAVRGKPYIEIGAFGFPLAYQANYPSVVFNPSDADQNDGAYPVQGNSANNSGIYGYPLACTILGGGSNVITGTSLSLYPYATFGSTIACGYGNVISNAFYSFAGGYLARVSASHHGSFVWSDYSSQSVFSTTSSNQFLVRALGGFGINTNNCSGFALNVAGSVNATNFYVNGTALTSSVQMVFTGTNTPVGNVTAPRGAIYNQFDAVATNTFIGQWINTNGITGWQ
jgi:hypothetical protein